MYFSLQVTGTTLKNDICRSWFGSKILGLELYVETLWDTGIVSYEGGFCFFHIWGKRCTVMFRWATTQLVACPIFILFFLPTESWALCPDEDRDKGANWDLNRCCVKIQGKFSFLPLCIFLSDVSNENLIVCQELPKHFQICWFAKRIYRTQKFLFLQFIKAKLYNIKSQRENMHGAKSGGNKSQTSKILLPVELKRMYELL